MDVYRRICQHFTGNGSLWTKKYKPLHVVSCQEGGKALESAVTASLVATKGFQNVRGAGYCQVEMQEPDWVLQAKDYQAWKSKPKVSSVGAQQPVLLEEEA